jgi:methyl-accepting chemotaxis protein
MKIKYIIISFIIIQLISTSVAILNSELLSTLSIIFITTTLIVITFGVFAISLIDKYIKEISNIDIVIEKAEDGDLRHRITNIEDKDLIGGVAWKINNLLDQVETFLRETSTAISATSHGKEYRIAMTRGLKGDFVSVLEQMNKSLIKVSESYKRGDFIENKMLPVVNEFENQNYDAQIDMSIICDEMKTYAEKINHLGLTLKRIKDDNRKHSIELENRVYDLNKYTDELINYSSRQEESLDGVSGSVGKIYEIIQNNNSLTQNMLKLSSETSESIKSGNMAAQDTQKAMDDISKGAQEINNAINAIDQIAFQTNILSLNAAVEAATAGEAGKGFAVVAGEVRNLASKSAEVAQDIKGLVETTLNKAFNGKELADTMMQNLEQLNANITRNSELINAVSKASKEQIVGIEDINNTTQELNNIISNSHQITNSVKNSTSEVFSMAKNLAES